MNLKIDLQFFSSGGTTTQQIPKRGPEPEELTNLREQLYNKLMPGLKSFSSNSWKQAQGITDNALTQMQNLSGQIPDALNRTNSLVDSLTNTVQTGNIPSAITDRLNAGVTKDLQSSLGTMLNGLSQRGVLNSSITSQGTSRLGQQAADAFNKNYLSAFNSVINGYGSALSGSQANTSALLQSLSAMSGLPKSAFNSVYAGITPAYTFWKDWQHSYDSSEPYDTVVTQDSSCITGDTLVTLEDGREIPVRELNDDDKIQAWDFDNGCITSAPLTAFFKRTEDNGLDIIRVEFEDGSNIGVVYEHLFFDLTAGKFVAINSDSQEFIGHEFAKVQDNKVIPVKVAKIFIDGKATKTYAPQCEGHLNFLTNGFITGNGGQLGICNMFDFDVNTMRYDMDKKISDLEKYGRLNYNALSDIISQEFFNANHCDEFSVAFGKGLITLEQFSAYLKKLSHCFLHIYNRKEVA